MEDPTHLYLTLKLRDCEEVMCCQYLELPTDVLILFLGVLMTDGDLWKEQRRFTMFHLKELGFGKSSLEVVMLEEASNLIAEFEVCGN